MDLAALLLWTLPGHYYLRGMHEVGADMLLRPNGTYEFALSYGAADWWSKGKWTVRDGSVLLNSDLQEELPPFKLIRSRAARDAAIRIRVQSPQGHGVENIDVALLTDKSKQYGRTDSNGIAVFPPGETPQTAAFRIPVYHLETELYELRHSHDDFTFEMDGDAIRAIRFNGERAAIRGQALVMSYWGPDRQMQFVKQ